MLTGVDWAGREGRMRSVEAVSLLLAQPGGRNPLRFSLQQVDLVQQLLVRTVRVTVTTVKVISYVVNGWKKVVGIYDGCFASTSSYKHMNN